MGHKRLPPTRLKDLFGASRNRSRTSSGSAQLAPGRFLLGMIISLN